MLWLSLILVGCSGHPPSALKPRKSGGSYETLDRFSAPGHDTGPIRALWTRGDGSWETTQVYDPGWIESRETPLGESAHYAKGP